jgi:uncharacterized membrane protein
MLLINGTVEWKTAFLRCFRKERQHLFRDMTTTAYVSFELDSVIFGDIFHMTTISFGDGIEQLGHDFYIYVFKDDGDFTHWHHASLIATS